KDDLSHFGRIAVLLAPMRLQPFGKRAYRRFIVRKQSRRIPVCTSAPVGAYAAGLERADLHAKRRHFRGERLGKSSNGPLGSVVRRIAGNGGYSTAHGRYLKDATAPLLAHDRE